MRPDPLAGVTVAGRYVVDEVLGRGGMAEVRAGRDLRLDRPVAIKFLSEAMAERPATHARFAAEARASAGLNHPNVVQVYDTGEHGGRPYLVMERLPGRTLAEELMDGPLSPDRARRVGADILAALGAADQAGIVHRDVKPSNVLLTAEGRAKVADFGIAKSVEDVDLTTTGTLLGTPAYLSPEQVMGERVTFASDLYSVGVVLYEALAGVRPFKGPTPIAIAHAIQTSEPTPLGNLRPDVPLDLATVVATAMEKEPGRRFASARDMAAALRGGLAAGSPIGPVAEPTVPVATETMARTQVLGATGMMARPAGAPLSPPRERRSRRPLLALAAVAVAVAAVALALAMRNPKSTSVKGEGSSTSIASTTTPPTVAITTPRTTPSTTLPATTAAPVTAPPTTAPPTPPTTPRTTAPPITSGPTTTRPSLPTLSVP